MKLAGKFIDRPIGSLAAVTVKVASFRVTCFQWKTYCTQGAKSLYLAKKRLEVTSPAIVVLNAFLDSSDLPKEGLSGLLWKFFWRDALIRRYVDVLFVIYS